jgi:hypothetical protein
MKVVLIVIIVMIVIVVVVVFVVILEAAIASPCPSLAGIPRHASPPKSPV